MQFLKGSNQRYLMEKYEQFIQVVAKIKLLSLTGSTKKLPSGNSFLVSGCSQLYMHCDRPLYSKSLFLSKNPFTQYVTWN